MTPDAPGLTWWLTAGLFLALAGLVPVLAALLERSGPIRLRHWADEAGGRLQQLNQSPARLEAFRYLMSLLARVMPLVLFVALRLALERLGMAATDFWALGLIAIWLGLAEAVNRVLVARDPESALRRLTGTYRLSLVLLAPLVTLLAPLLSGPTVDRREDEDDVSDEEIEAYIDVGKREGILDSGEQDLLLRVIDFGDALVRSVVTPRIDMVCAPVDSSLDELADLFLESKHSRIPLYRESIDQIVGVLHIRDLLAGLRRQPRPAATELAHPPYVVPETKPLNELLREFQSQRQQLAIVVDEFGGSAGLVTVEDLLEEIVGEIVDEHEELELNEPQPDGSWRLDGGTPLDALQELFGAAVAEEPYETVGGLIFGRLGYLPEPGEKLEAFGLELTVERVEGRRIKSVIALQLPPADGVAP